MASVVLVSFAIILDLLVIADDHCSYIQASPTDVCSTQYSAYSPIPYTSFLGTCIDGYPFILSWDGLKRPNNCIGPPTSKINATNGSGGDYNCKYYPNSCGYYNRYDVWFNGTDSDECTDQYVVRWANFAFKTGVCGDGIIAKCTDDSYTEMFYTYNNCTGGVFANITTGNTHCALTSGVGWTNETITYCGPGPHK